MTQQSHPTKPSMKSKILALLEDGEWHVCNELINYGLSYRNRIAELRAEGHDIQSMKDGKRPTYKYKLHKPVQFYDNEQDLQQYKLNLPY